jgi:hypothetical protein
VNFLSMLLVLPLGMTQAVPPSGHVLRFSLDRKGPPVMQYTIEIDEQTGAGSYRPAPAMGGPGAAPPSPEPLQVSASVLNKLITAVPAIKSQHCESHIKGIAQTGKKTMVYTGDGAPVECTFNYSDDEHLNDAASVFEAVAETLQIGGRLASKHRFDRLGLDAEVDGLVSALAEGRAAEVMNIAPVLRSITEDERVMERVRRKTAHLLENAGGVQARVGADSSDR